ncbi:MAG: hypothetical protein K2O40_15125 [Lachnospiraceae bacterium]|nr:hypothetical protein [Lachnospiraceae bacterium]
MNILHKIWLALERSNKKTLINASGSIPGAKLEKIRSGQTYLYQKDGVESEVMEIRFQKKVRDSILGQALTETMKRYPYLNTKLIELDGDFYIVKNDIQLTPRKTRTLAKLGHASCGHHLIDIAFYDKTIFVSWHHALCDGKGIKPFVETLIYYYCRLRYRSLARSEGIRLSDSDLLPGESTDPNIGSYSYDESKEFVDISRDAYAIPENTVKKTDTYYRYEIQISASPFMRICKANHATPVILTSLLVSAGIADIYPDFDKPINANIAVDIRDALDLPNTFKNCVRSMPLPFGRDFLAMPLIEQAKKQRTLLNAQRDRNNCRKAANFALEVFDKVDSLSDYKAKQNMMGFFDGMLMNTYVISYLGQMVLNENAQYIDTIYFYNSGTAGLGVTMLACGDKFCYNFKQSFESDKYAKAFCAGLKRLGIEYTISDVIPFATPKDSIIKRN